MFDEQIAAIADPTKVSYAKIAEGINTALFSVAENQDLSDIEQVGGAVGAALAGLLMLLKKLELQEVANEG